MFRDRNSGDRATFAVLLKTKCTYKPKTQCLLVRNALDVSIDQLYIGAMIVRKGYKYWLQTNPETKQIFAQYAGSCRFVWNKVLATGRIPMFQAITM
jgi:Helix-turn-helix domain